MIPASDTWAPVEARPLARAWEIHSFDSRVSFPNTHPHRTGRLLEDRSQSASDLENRDLIQGIFPGYAANAVGAEEFRFSGHIQKESSHFCRADQGVSRYNMRGKGMVSRTCSSPQIQATTRSMPIPKPECGTVP